MKSTINKLLISLGLSLIFGMQAFATNLTIEIKNIDCNDGNFVIVGLKPNAMNLCLDPHNIPVFVPKNKTSKKIDASIFCDPLPVVRQVGVCSASNLLGCRAINAPSDGPTPYKIHFKQSDGACIWTVLN